MTGARPEKVMPTGYLLDTNVISAYHSKKHDHHGFAVDFLDLGPPSKGIPVFLSVVNLMELDFGVRLATERDGLRRPNLDKMMVAVNAYDHRPVNRFVVEAYSEMRVRIAMRFLPRRIRELAKLGEIERWRDEITNELLQVQEGDMWLAAQATVLDLTLVTLEKTFVRFKEIPHPGLVVRVLPEDEE